MSEKLKKDRWHPVTLALATAAAGMAAYAAHNAYDKRFELPIAREEAYNAGYDSGRRIGYMEGRIEGVDAGINDTVCAALDLGILGEVRTEEFDLTTDLGARRAAAADDIAAAKRNCND